MSATTAPARRLPVPDEPIPAISLPALGLLLGGLALWWGSTFAYIEGVWPWPVSVPLNAIACYMLFTVSHDAAHHSLSRTQAANTWLGRIATVFFAPHAGFRTWRFIHMQHHRFTNHDDGNDPDNYTNVGPAWQRPLRWLSIDLYYMVFYLPRLGSRPRPEKIELACTWAIVFGACAAAIATGHLWGLLLIYFLPVRLSIIFLAWAFDYLPHHGLHHTPEEDRLKTTRNRVGRERLLSPVLLYQNYHLVHHLHPLVPFHRYVKVWFAGEDRYLEGDPALSTVAGRPLSVGEYRHQRGLAPEG
ncbi:MAG TPA: fatty acid desaturase [Solirubrobacteraceae bacterium]|nr:fatty acid desaturase [Solirubrobacteraceae bacterium]